VGTSPRAMKELPNATPSTVPATLTSPRVPKTVAESGSCIHSACRHSRIRPISAVNVMSSGPDLDVAMTPPRGSNLDVERVTAA
jgi:hypothetical protein